MAENRRMHKDGVLVGSTEDGGWYLELPEGRTGGRGPGGQRDAVLLCEAILDAAGLHDVRVVQHKSGEAHMVTTGRFGTGE